MALASCSEGLLAASISKSPISATKSRNVSQPQRPSHGKPHFTQNIHEGNEVLGLLEFSRLKAFRPYILEKLDMDEKESSLVQFQSRSQLRSSFGRHAAHILSGSGDRSGA